ncbi:hypothetical protein [Fibrobacter sp. UBA3718]|uniref:hypothetical protein n=1 Tax=Fibrobacter sp. UBA3718 TaxID=1946531 RepID=UPI0025C66CAC|nr:hypothetical protein [Fibrobacter sp. UBA3718]
MTEQEIETRLMKLYNDMLAMRYAFGNIEEMADCDEPPKRGSNYTIDFIKKGRPYHCSVKSNDWCEIYPEDLMPALECFKQCCQDKLKYEYAKYQQIVKGIEILDKLLHSVGDFFDKEFL